MQYDILIRGGTLYDGSGAAGVAGDVAVVGKRIEAVGDVPPGEARQVIDASGLAVTPGFIDIKTHSDFSLPVNPTADSKVRQGVTTEIIGHCGFSMAPLLPGKLNLLRDYLNASASMVPFREMSFSEYLDTFPATSVNAGMLVGHNTMRLMAMGMENRAPTSAELTHMQQMLDEGLAAGALGLSTGLFTTPGAYAQAPELQALCEVVKQHNASYFTHLRDESHGVIDSVREAIELARHSGVHVQICHFKCSGLDSWGKAGQVLEMVTAAKLAGVQVDLDLYPYTAGTNPLKNLLPQWVQAGGVGPMLERLADPAVRQHVREDIERVGMNNWGRLPSWDCLQLALSPSLGDHVGRTIGALAQERGQDPVELACDAIVADGGATRVIVFSIAEDDVRELIRSPLSMIGSDGNCVADCGITSQGKPHPRFYGTFPRVIGHYVDELNLISLESAIHKFTGAPATSLRLADRGFLRAGLRADIAVFDPKNFRERATYQDPHRYPSGERTSVLVAGQPVVLNAQHTGATPGSVLRRDRDGIVH